LVTSETDKKALLKLVHPDSEPAPISVLPNGVDLDFFRPNLDVERDAETLVFSGKMSYHANISMVKFLAAEIMPGIWAKRPSVRLLIVGKDPTADVRALGADTRIIVTGTVDDIRPYLWKAAIAVVPLVYGAGIQNKVLEAMACGTPVVTTSRTLSSLAVISGRELIAADGAEEFSSAVLNLLSEQNQLSLLSSASMDYVRKNHNWTELARQLTSYYEESINTL